MKKQLLALFTIFALTSFSAQASEVGIIDVEKIVKESKAMKYLQSKVSKKQEEYQKEVTKTQSKLESEQKNLEGKRSVLSKEAFEKEVKKFEEKVNDLKDFVDKRQNSLKAASLEGMNKVNDEIKDIISDLAKERNFDVIIPAAQALFYNDSLDVSDEVLKRLNKKITKVSVKFK